MNIHEKINIKSWFKPENLDKWFMRINRPNIVNSTDDIFKADEPFMVEKYAFLRGWKHTTQIVRQAKK